MKSRNLRMLTILIPCMLMLMSCPFPFQPTIPTNIVYVDRAAANGKDGTSWDQAMDDLQEGIEEAASHATSDDP